MRMPTGLRISANVRSPTNVCERSRLRIWLRMFTPLRISANVSMVKKLCECGCEYLCKCPRPCECPRMLAALRIWPRMSGGGFVCVPPGMKKGGIISRLSVLSFWGMLSFVIWINNPPSVQRHFVVLLKRHNYDAYAVGPGSDHYFGIVYDSIKIFFYVVLQVF